MFFFFNFGLFWFQAKSTVDAKSPNKCDPNQIQMDDDGDFKPTSASDVSSARGEENTRSNDKFEQQNILEDVKRHRTNSFLVQNDLRNNENPDLNNLKINVNPVRNELKNIEHPNRRLEMESKNIVKYVLYH